MANITWRQMADPIIHRVLTENKGKGKKPGPKPTDPRSIETGPVVELLTAKRIPENDATSIIDFAAPQITGCDWSATGQNDLFLLILMQEYVKPLALNWIESNRPEAWYKSMFTP